ncbi:MAG: DNA polymerase III subunit gamma/tau [Mycoplasmataceae bacterium]|nr:DNA polymerase III subunit gamma/tau [Mycoplasmataceae bacterium]
MSKSLYSIYRPQQFSQVIGQDVAKTILINSILENKINHAYLFFGIRGTGKTTLARLFAKAINCQETQERKIAEPCGKCSSCLEITNQSAMDVIEIDAASNNGIDEIRDLKEKANYKTSSLKYKVYIIDEIHMLSKSAFNALLKILEEPPKNTIFLLATTEINRIPETVLSRTIIINLEIIANDAIKTGLEFILNQENITYEKDVLNYLTLVSGGSMRDAITALETAIIFNSELTTPNVLKALGLIKYEDVKKLLLSDPLELAELIKQSDKDPQKSIYILMQVITDQIRVGNKKFNNLLTEILNTLISIKDPSLLKLSLYALILKENMDLEVTDEVKPQWNEIKSNAVENVSRETNRNISLQKIVENNNDSQSKSNEEKIPSKQPEKSSVEVITDYLKPDHYLTILFQNDKILLEKIKVRWDYIVSYATNNDFKQFVSCLIKTKPIAVNKQGIILGIENLLDMAEIKRISLSKEFLVFIKELTGKELFILPISMDNWKIVVNKYKEIKGTGVFDFVNIKIPPKIIIQKNPKSELENIFGDKLIYE